MKLAEKVAKWGAKMMKGVHRRDEETREAGKTVRRVKEGGRKVELPHQEE